VSADSDSIDDSDAEDTGADTDASDSEPAAAEAAAASSDSDSDSSSEDGAPPARDRERCWGPGADAERGADRPHVADPVERARLLALGTVMLDKRKRDGLIDDSFNRYAFNDDNLPPWCVALDAVGWPQALRRAQVCG
jgi:AdoMet-dependent rRNA methyltransferase SPB1